MRLTSDWVYTKYVLKSGIYWFILLYQYFSYPFIDSKHISPKWSHNFLFALYMQQLFLVIWFLFKSNTWQKQVMANKFELIFPVKRSGYQAIFW